MDLPLFLLTVAFISLSGVLMPGPVFAAAVAKGARDRHAGAWIALGHLLVEVPLIILIALGLSFVLSYGPVTLAIATLGGALLVWMGVSMFLRRGSPDEAAGALPGHPLFAGMLTTVTNPYYLLWWATVGALLISQSLAFGLTGLILLILVHEACDAGWDYLVGYLSYRSTKVWGDRASKWVFGVCGVGLAGFGVYFAVSAWL